jgi:NADH-quinone oxidoreductase subunit J
MEMLHLFLCSLFLQFSTSVSLSSNPVHSVIYLILTFCITAFISFFFNLEFFGLIFVIIYVGAVAVLFLFIIMMLDIKENFLTKFSLFNLILINFLVLFFETLAKLFFFEVFSNKNFLATSILFFDTSFNMDILGQCLYNFFLICFLISGLILFVALLGSIVLTLNFNISKKSQKYFRQLSRSDRFLLKI